MEKRCIKCRKKKTASEFNKRDGKCIGKCKACQAKYWKSYYAQDTNRRKHIKRNRARVKIHRKELYAFVNAIKDKPCLDCGLKFPSCAMQFDHVRGTKLRVISFMVRRMYSKKKILEEIAKCELVCANCHSIRTFRRA